MEIGIGACLDRFTWTFANHDENLELKKIKLISENLVWSEILLIFNVFICAFLLNVKYNSMSNQIL